MSLDTAGDASSIDSTITSFKSPDPNAGDAYLSTLETIIDNGFQKATPTMGNVDISPPAGTFKIPYKNPGSSDMPELIGQACADYWMLAIAPGTPEVCAAIDSVTNDAAKIASPIASNLRGLFAKGYLKPYYYDFVNAIHAEVLTINWTVSESDGSGCSATLTVNVT